MNQQVTEHPAATVMASRARSIRINSLAMAVIVLIEYGFGLWVNLYAQLPAADRGASISAGFGRAVANGPAGLTIHALLGVALLAGAITEVVRAVRIASPRIIALASVALLAIIAAAANGSRFVGDQSNGASLAMGLSAAVAILCYVIIMFAPEPRLGERRRVDQPPA
jgi:hypothetical protein